MYGVFAQKAIFAHGAFGKNRTIPNKKALILQENQGFCRGEDQSFFLSSQG